MRVVGTQLLLEVICHATKNLKSPLRNHVHLLPPCRD